MRDRSFASLLAALATLASSEPGVAAPTITEIGGLTPGSTGPNAVSADGSVVVGASPEQELVERAFRWTAGGGSIDLGDLPGGCGFGNGAVSNNAMAASADGSVVAGRSGAACSEAFRWTADTGMVGLGALPDRDYSYAQGVSADGSVVVGASTSNFTSAIPTEAFRWTAADGMIGLGELPGGDDFSIALAVSADGSAVAGFSESASGNEAFRWTAGSGIVGLGGLPGGTSSSVAYAISGDGSTIVGSSNSASGSEAFRWTQASGMVGLGDLPTGGFHSTAKAVSADGSIIVGSSNVGTSDPGDDEPVAFIWDAEHGMRSLRDVLSTELGLDLDGWYLSDARGISADGLTIVGVDYLPGLEGTIRNAWIVVIPEPSSGLLLVTGLLALAYEQRRIRRSELEAPKGFSRARAS